MTIGCIKLIFKKTDGLKPFTKPSTEIYMSIQVTNNLKNGNAQIKEITSDMLVLL